MKTFEEFRFSIPHNKVKLEHKYFPKSKEELVNAIEAEIKSHGPKANLNCIDTSEITDMSYLFEWDPGTYADGINCNVSEWDVSNVTNMDHMFCNAANFDQDLSKWDVSKVTNMSYMFYSCKKFNGNIKNWDTSSLEDSPSMFEYCENFNCDLSKWDMSKVKNMAYMFRFCEKFNQDLSGWNCKRFVRNNHMFDYTAIKEEYKPKFN